METKKTNRYPTKCRKCGGYVPANKGYIVREGRKWVGFHNHCETEIVVTRFSSGAEVYQNRRGRCEDAPCCGCCS